jgi:hypothetical protein
MYQIFLQVLSPEVGDKVISELTRYYAVTKTKSKQGMVSFLLDTEEDVNLVFDKIVDILNDWVWFSIVIVGVDSKINIDYAEGNFRSKLNVDKH